MANPSILTAAGGKAVALPPGQQTVILTVPTDATNLGFGAGIGLPVCAYEKQFADAQITGVSGAATAIQLVGSSDPVDFNTPANNAPTHWDPVAQDASGRVTFTTGDAPNVAGFLSPTGQVCNWIAAKWIAGVAVVVTQCAVNFVDQNKVRPQ